MHLLYHLVQHQQAWHHRQRISGQPHLAFDLQMSPMHHNLSSTTSEIPIFGPLVNKLHQYAVKMQFLAYDVYICTTHHTRSARCKLVRCTVCAVLGIAM